MNDHRDIALEAIRQFEVEPTRIRLLDDGYNVTYRVDDVMGRRFALRVGRPEQTASAVAAEVAWCDAINAQTDLRTLNFVPTRSGDRLATARERVCVLSGWVSGAQRSRGLSANMLEVVGEAMATLHDQAETWTPPRGWDRPLLNTVWLDAPDPTPGLPDDTGPLFKRVEQRLLPLLARLTAETCFVLHADLHQGNYRFDSGHDIGIIDFDDTSLGHPVQDIAISFYYLRRLPKYDVLRAAFRRGYERRRLWPLDDATLSALIIWRALGLCASVETHENPKLRAYGRTLLPAWADMCRDWLVTVT